jgi:glycolate oxidase
MQAGAELIARARLVCGDGHVIVSPTLLSVYRSDGTTRDGPPPLAAALPGTGAEVERLVSACRETATPYVVRGAGTSTGGGALPRSDALLIVLTRMRRILEHRSGSITVEPGTPTDMLARIPGAPWLAEAPASYALASPRRVGTVGGHVGETAGLSNVQALELIDPSGRRVRVESGLPGYDIAGAFPGSRGRAGIAIAITLRALLESRSGCDRSE